MWTAPDGHEVRRIDWPLEDDTARGSILFFPGRGDHYEKYLETLEEWHRAGWRVTAADWRGQAGSGRLGGDATTGHVEDFQVWLDDLAAFWRAWKTADGRTIDQIKNVVDQIKNNPDSRRLLVVAYNPGVVDEMALPPCHAFFQFYVADGKLSCQLYQRSADIFLGVPFNIASYALLTMMIAQVCGLKPGEFIHTLGDAHLYSNHIEQTKLQLSRDPFPLPEMHLNPHVTDIFDFKFEDFELVGYQAHDHIKAPVAV